MLFFASPAHAEPAAGDGAVRFSVAVAPRPLTLPSLIVAPEAAFDVDRQGSAGDYGYLGISARAGITDDLEVHALVAPLQLWSPGVSTFRYGETTQNQGPAVGVRYRFVRGPVEVAADVTGRVYTVEYLSGGAIEPSVPVRIHATPFFRVDVVPTATFVVATETATTPDRSANAVRLHFPVTLLGDLSESFYLGMTTGLTIYDVSNTRNSTGIPLGVLGGVAIPGPHGPVVDIGPYFTFPYLAMPGRAKETNTDQYVVGVNLTGYLYL
ncbi:MAG TPA: hypothetical protein VIF09_02760 [Polyangiaceae bacterium]